MTSQNIKDMGWVVLGIGFFILIIAMVIFVDIPSYIRAHQACSTGNGTVIQQKDFLNPYVCLKVNPGIQP